MEPDPSLWAVGCPQGTSFSFLCGLRISFISAQTHELLQLPTYSVLSFSFLPVHYVSFLSKNTAHVNNLKDTKCIASLLK